MPPTPTAHNVGSLQFGLQKHTQRNPRRLRLQKDLIKIIVRPILGFVVNIIFIFIQNKSVKYIIGLTTYHLLTDKKDNCNCAVYGLANDAVHPKKQVIFKYSFLQATYFYRPILLRNVVQLKTVLMLTIMLKIILKRQVTKDKNALLKYSLHVYRLTHLLCLTLMENQGCNSNSTSQT